MPDWKIYAIVKTFLGKSGKNTLFDLGVYGEHLFSHFVLELEATFHTDIYGQKITNSNQKQPPHLGVCLEK